MRSHSRHSLLLAAAALLLAGPANAQNLLDFWIPNGPVQAAVYDPARERLYIGGRFDRIGAPTGAGALVDATTGAVMSPLLRIGPLGAVVRTVVPDGANGWFIGGDFSEVGGLPRQNLAHVDQLGNVTSWNPGADGSVRTLALSSGVLYVGGAFTTLAGQPRTRLGSLDPSNGSVGAWGPTANDTVKFIGVASSTVYLGGDFTQINGTARNHVAALNTSSPGSLTTWNPNADAAVRAIYRGSTSIALGGDFLNVGGTSQPHVAVVNTTTGAPTPSVVSANGSVYTFEADATHLFVGGAFTSIGGASRTGLAAFNLSTLTLDTSWNAALDGAVRDLFLLGSQLYVVGDFQNAGAGRRAGAVRVSTAGATVGAWDPRSGALTCCVGATAVNSFVGGNFVVVNYENSTANYHRNLAVYDFSPSSPTFGRPLAIPLDVSYAAGSSSVVYSLAFRDPDLYVGGAFDRVNGVARNGGASLEVGLWGTNLWSPNPNAPITTMDTMPGAGNPMAIGGTFTTPGANVALVHPTTGGVVGSVPAPSPLSNLLQVGFAEDGSYLFYAGSFDMVGGVSRRRFAMLPFPFSSVTGPDPFPADSISNGNFFWTKAVEASNQYAWVGGFFLNYGTRSRQNLLQLDLFDGMPTSWSPNPDGGIDALGRSGSRLYASGSFGTVFGLPRTNLAGFDLGFGGALTYWNPSLRSGITRTIAAASNRVAVGGDFDGANGVYNPYLVVFDDNSTTVDVGERPRAPDLSLAITPNPAGERATVAFSLPAAAKVSLEILDLQGRIVRQALKSSALTAGEHRVVVDAGGLAAGVYVVRLRAGARTSVARWAHVR